MILNIVSVGAAWGVLAIMWQNGHGSDLLWGIEATGSVPAWIPLMVFAFLFGLSMDYEVFILSRMREEFDATGDTRTAVIRGIGRTGRLVTSAALILFLAFISLASGPGTDLKMFATGLAAGILLDATVVRALLVPAVVSLFGRWNWILPAGRRACSGSSRRCRRGSRRARRHASAPVSRGQPAPGRGYCRLRLAQAAAGGVEALGWPSLPGGLFDGPGVARAKQGVELIDADALRGPSRARGSSPRRRPGARPRGRPRSAWARWAAR